jgi:hypothetical protein
LAGNAGAGRYRCTLVTSLVVGFYSSDPSLLELLIVIALNCIHDLILTFLPLVILKDLNITRRVKVILGVLMGMSIL